MMLIFCHHADKITFLLQKINQKFLSKQKETKLKCLEMFSLHCLMLESKFSLLKIISIDMELFAKVSHEALLV
jgi:hypothetical protein